MHSYVNYSIFVFSALSDVFVTSGLFNQLERQYKYSGIWLEASGIFDEIIMSRINNNIFMPNTISI